MTPNQTGGNFASFFKNTMLTDGYKYMSPTDFNEVLHIFKYEGMSAILEQGYERIFTTKLSTGLQNLFHATMQYTIVLSAKYKEPLAIELRWQQHSGSVLGKLCQVVEDIRRGNYPYKVVLIMDGEATEAAWDYLHESMRCPIVAGRLLGFYTMDKFLARLNKGEF